MQNKKPAPEIIIEGQPFLVPAVELIDYPQAKRSPIKQGMLDFIDQVIDKPKSENT